MLGGAVQCVVFGFWRDAYFRDQFSDSFGIHLRCRLVGDEEAEFLFTIL